MSKYILMKVKEAFTSRFQQSPSLFFAPGRINLIGEHTDYNDGWVLPAAVGQGIGFAIHASADNSKCHIIALDLDEEYTFDLRELSPLPQNSWQNYVLGVANEIIKSGRKLRGFNMVFSGDVPRGSGMSSSAALECGTCLALNELFELNIPKIDMIKMSQMAEHTFAGVKCGIMDQFASMMGKADNVLLLDCKTHEYTHFPFQLRDYSLVLCNSNVSHSLASSEYNVRRQQCEEGVALLNKAGYQVSALRDVSLHQLDAVKEKIDPIVYKRCKYVIEENERVKRMTKALQGMDLQTAGELLKQAQKAMQYEYEVTCPEIDFMADFANSRTDILGARMMGGGFGGCTINLVKKGSEKTFYEDLNVAYQKAFNKKITPIEIVISDGVHSVPSL